MTALGCHDVEELLVDYLENDLTEGRRTEIRNHLRSCTSCAAALREFENVRAALRRDTTLDPGPAFWKSFPDRMWQAHRAEVKSTAVGKLSARWLRVRAVVESFVSAPRWVPVAALLLIAIGASYLVVRTSVDKLDAAAFQARIHTDTNLANLARDAQIDLSPSNQFGFSQADGSANFFQLGRWYSESLAYSAGGDAETARARLTAIAAALRSAAPRSAELLGGEPSVQNIAALEPRLLRAARSGGERDEALFRAGVWLENLALAALAGDQDALHTVAPSLVALERDLESAQITPGARRDLRELSGILTRETLSASDFTDVRRLVRRIQTTLM